ncbi:MAG: DUF4097 family beta strand repeat protein [Lewinellaceae bacterium]|nr:DUF4097 family beta strand repeat protein [Lewinellaceae bacterium]
MKSKAFSALMSALLLLSLAGTLQAADPIVNGPKREFSKTINREFSTSADGMTALYNKHGKVNVNTWDKNSVKIDITIIVNSSDQRDADRAFEQIKVNFTNSHGYVKAETVIDDGKMNYCRDFKINYEVWMPNGNQLDLKNKYGNSFVAKLNGKLTAEIKYGDLRTEAIANDVDLTLGYGKATIERLRNFYGQISYGGLIVTDAGDLQLDSKYSETRIDRVKVARITSKYDDFSFGQVAELRLQTKYSDVRVGKMGTGFITAQYTDLQMDALLEFLDADLSYGDLQIKALSRNFREVSVVGKYTDIALNTEPGSSFRFDAEGNYTDLHYPSNAKVSHKSVDGTRKTVSGFVGDADARSIVKAKLSYGDFVIR